MASELRHTAAKMRAKLYFLSTGAGSSGEEGGDGKGTAIKATAGDIVRFQVHIFMLFMHRHLMYKLQNEDRRNFAFLNQ